MTQDRSDVAGRQTFYAFALSKGSIAHHVFISVGPVILPHVDPEGINRVALCGFMERRVADQLQRPCRAVSKGGFCKRPAVSAGFQLHFCCTVSMRPFCEQSSAIKLVRGHHQRLVERDLVQHAALTQASWNLPRASHAPRPPLIAALARRGCCCGGGLASLCKLFWGAR